MNKLVFLIGFMGTGKTTISTSLGAYLSCEVKDTDQMIVDMEKRSIAKIFETNGEEYFRDLETRCLQELDSSALSIISCGGGIVLRNQNVDIMREKGINVLLTAEPVTILNRIKNDKNRPLLQGRMKEEYITELLERRKKFYENAADISISTDDKTTDEIICEIVKEIKRTEEIHV